MDSNYFDTAKRMYKSSETLHTNGEFHNACYLAGYVVECYAKIIVALAYDDTAIARDFYHDLKNLDKELQYILQNSSYYSSYIANMRADFSKILSGTSKWHPNKRYNPLTNVYNSTNSNDYQSEINIAMGILTQMSLDTSSNLI